MILYLDTSSLVKLYVLEKGSTDIRSSVVASVAVATSVIAYPELHSALTRKRRKRAISEREYNEIVTVFDREWDTFLRIVVTDLLAKTAGRLSKEYSLTGADAVHLASAVEIREKGPKDTRFFSSDGRLNAAAKKERFETN